MNARSGPTGVQGAAARPLNAVLAMLVVATAVVVATEFIVVGLLPMMARDLEISLSRAGWLVTSFALSSALLGPPLTIAASGLEPRRALVATLLAFAIGNLLVALAPRYDIILAVRVVQGATLPAFVSIGSTAVALLAGPGREGWAIALVNMGVVVGIVLAVPAGVAVADGTGWIAIFAGLAIGAAIATALVAFVFPRLGRSGPASVASQAAILRRPAFQAHLLLSAVLFTAMFAAYSYLAAFLETVAGFDGGRVALALMGFGVAGLIGNWTAGRVVDRAPTAATAGAAVALCLAMSAVSLAGGELTLLLPLLAVWGAAHTAAFVLCQVRVMLAGSRAPAFASSLNISACNLGIAFGAVAGGWVVERHGIGAVGFGGAALAACALVIAGLLAATPASERSFQCPDAR